MKTERIVILSYNVMYTVLENPSMTLISVFIHSISGDLREQTAQISDFSFILIQAFTKVIALHFMS